MVDDAASTGPRIEPLVHGEPDATRRRLPPLALLDVMTACA
jgi:hypothetical protein